MRFVALTNIATLAALFAVACFIGCSNDEEVGTKCEANPNAGKLGAGVPVEALPKGACSEGSASCSILVQQRCPCFDDLGAADGYDCVCKGGSWSCSITSKGMTACSRLPPSCTVFDAGSAD